MASIVGGLKAPNQRNTMSCNFDFNNKPMCFKIDVLSEFEAKISTVVRFKLEFGKSSAYLYAKQTNNSHNILQLLAGHLRQPQSKTYLP